MYQVCRERWSQFGECQVLGGLVHRTSASGNRVRSRRRFGAGRPYSGSRSKSAHHGLHSRCDALSGQVMEYSNTSKVTRCMVHNGWFTRAQKQGDANLTVSNEVGSRSR
jgi:hypothetical protein